MADACANSVAGNNWLGKLHAQGEGGRKFGVALIVLTSAILGLTVALVVLTAILVAR